MGIHKKELLIEGVQRTIMENENYVKEIHKHLEEKDCQITFLEANLVDAKETVIEGEKRTSILQHKQMEAEQNLVRSMDEYNTQLNVREETINSLNQTIIEQGNKIQNLTLSFHENIQ